MPIRIPVHTVILARVKEGQTKPERIIPPIGKPFDFTADEIKSITKANKFALRKPVNESVAVDDEGNPLTAKAAVAADKSGKGSGAGKGTGKAKTDQAALPAPGQDPGGEGGEGGEDL